MFESKFVLWWQCRRFELFEELDGGNGRLAVLIFDWCQIAHLVPRLIRAKELGDGPFVAADQLNDSRQCL